MLSLVGERKREERLKDRCERYEHGIWTFTRDCEENRDTKSLISSTLKSGVIGRITGGGLGWGVPSGSALFKAGKHDLNVKLGKSYGKPKIVPGFERINGKLFYGRRIDPNAPQFKKTLKRY